MINRNIFHISALSDAGLVRENNEDNLYVNGKYMQQGGQGNFKLSAIEKSGSLVCAVCDGMGGEKSGEKASLEAVSRLHLVAGDAAFAGMALEEKIKLINSYVGETNSAIYTMAAGSFESKGMGTTFACLVVSGGKAVAMNAGDSRVYLFRDGALTQLTHDHSESERLVRLGVITKEQARGHKSRFVLSRHFGMPPEEGLLEADVSGVVELRKGDTFLLCSDGLTDMINDEFIAKALLAEVDTQKAAESLVAEALKNGGHDNITAILVRVAHPQSIFFIKKKLKWILPVAIIFILLAVAFFALLQSRKPVNAPAVTRPIESRVPVHTRPIKNVKSIGRAN
jgi:protein phosphatase